MSQTNSSGTEAMEPGQHETRKFPPPADFAKQAHIGSYEQYEKMYKESIEDPDRFWGEHASELHWFKKWDRVWNGTCPTPSGSSAARLNACYNCVDRQVENGEGDKAAIVWEGEPLDGGIRQQGGSPHAHLQRPPERDRQVRQRAQEAGREEGRLRHALHAHGARAGDRHARLCPHRRAAQHHLRRLQRQRDQRPRRGRRQQDPHHRRRRVASRQGRAPQGQRR